MKKFMPLILLAMFSIATVAQTITDITVSQLPKATKDYISQNMPGGKITRAVKIDDKGTLKYGAQIETGGRKHILIFDKGGNFLQKGDNLKGNNTGTTPPVGSAKPGQSKAPGTNPPPSGQPSKSGEAGTPKSTPPAQGQPPKSTHAETPGTIPQSPPQSTQTGQSKKTDKSLPPSNPSPKPSQAETPKTSPQTQPAKVRIEAPGASAQPPAQSTQPGKAETPATSAEASDPVPVSHVKLPKKATSYISSNYPNGKMVSSSKLKQNDLLFYQATLTDGDKVHILTFDKKGKYVSGRSSTSKDKKTGE